MERRRAEKGEEVLVLPSSLSSGDLDVGSPLLRYLHQSNPTSNPCNSALNSFRAEINRLLNIQTLHRFAYIWRTTCFFSRHSSEFNLLSTTPSKPLITLRWFVTPMLTRAIAAILNRNLISVLRLPLGTAYELMRCQKRCHVFIHSISPKEKTTSIEELI